jgi:L-cysteine/cystine lyase
MNRFRNDLPALSNKDYFNYGGQGPLPKSSLHAITNSWEKIQELGPFTNDVWPFISNEIKGTKSLIAEFCGVTSRRIALTENVTSGCVLPLWGLPFSKGDRLLISNCEHPGVVSACKELAKRKDLHIDILDVLSLRRGVEGSKENQDEVIKTIEGGLTARTKLVVLSHLLWNTGQIMPIELVANLLVNQPNQPYFLVDAAQSFGQIPIRDSASKVDIYAFTGHKWAFGPEGLGAVVLSERVLEEASPTLVGWKALTNESSIYTNAIEPFHKDARRFEIATSCTPLLAGLRCSLNLLKEQGTDSERINSIKLRSKRLWLELKGVTSINPVLQDPPPAGLVSFTINSKLSPNQIVKLLAEESIYIRVLEDPIWLRACVHITSTEREIERLITALKKIVVN